MAKERVKFSPDEVEPLLQKAKAGDLNARNELVERFQRLVVSLVNVCLTGRFFTSYQKTFLRMLGGKSTPMQNIAMMLKMKLVDFKVEELYRTGQLSIMLAIEKCNSNLASTIVICFRDLIYSMIKDNKNEVPFSEAINNIQVHYEDEMVDRIMFEVFLETLTEEEQIVVEAIISGEKVEIPNTLRSKFSEYIGIPLLDIGD